MVDLQGTGSFRERLLDCLDRFEEVDVNGNQGDLTRAHFVFFRHLILHLASDCL